MEAKEKMQLEILDAVRGLVPEEYVDVFKSAMEVQMYNYDVVEKSTELALYEGSKTEKLLRYFAIGKLSAKMQEETLEQYIRTAWQVVDLVHKELDEVTKEDIKYFLIRYQQIHKVSDCTMDCKRRYLSSLFKYLHANEVILKNPMSAIEVIKYKKVVKQPLRDEEVERIRMACKTKRDIAIVMFFLETGVRVTELCRIKLSDVDFAHYRCKVLGKGNKERIVHFTGKSYVFLMEYLKERKDVDIQNIMYSNFDDKPLFAERYDTNAHLTKRAVDMMVEKLRGPSGVARLHCHLFRATYATNLSKKGVSIELIAKALGHADLNTISRYVLTGDEELELALRKAGSAV